MVAEATGEDKGDKDKDKSTKLSLKGQ